MGTSSYETTKEWWLNIIQNFKAKEKLIVYYNKRWIEIKSIRNLISESSYIYANFRESKNKIFIEVLANRYKQKSYNKMKRAEEGAS